MKLRRHSHNHQGTQQDPKAFVAHLIELTESGQLTWRWHHWSWNDTQYRDLHATYRGRTLDAGSVGWTLRARSHEAGSVDLAKGRCVLQLRKAAKRQLSTTAAGHEVEKRLMASELLKLP